MDVSQSNRRLDRQTCVIDVGSGQFGVRVTRFFELLTQCKGLIVEFQPLTSSLTPAVKHRKMQVEGFWPSVNWLLELRPYPTLMPETPDRRAAVASLTELILLQPESLVVAAPLYDDSPFAFGHQTCLVDLAIASYHETAHARGLPWVARVHDNVNRTREEVEPCE